jgi:hypothetical protein
MQELPSRKYVPEKYRNCTSEQISCCNGNRYHHCFADFKKIALSEKDILDVLDKICLLIDKYTSKNKEEKCLLIVSGTELMGVLQGSLSVKVGCQKQTKRKFGRRVTGSLVKTDNIESIFIGDFALTKNFSNTICHGHEIPSSEDIEEEFLRFLGLCSLFGIVVKNLA